jgi:predicted anti-sigma-YlaC factor YlaD
MPQRWVEEHLLACERCRGWADASAEVTRRARLAPAERVPDVTAAVLAQLPVAGGRPRRERPRREGVTVLLRWLLMAVGAGQLALGSSVFDAGGMAMGMSMPEHLSHETGAWNVALAACFLAVAVLPRLAVGALPVLLSFTALLGWVTVSDLRAGHVPADRAVDHLLLVAGALLVSALAYRRRAGRGDPIRERVRRLASWPRTGHAAGATPGPVEPAVGRWQGEDPVVASRWAA